MRFAPTSLAVALALALAACGKASETAAEKMIESSMQKDGGKAKVDLSGGSASITTTDAAGKTSQLQFGAAQVSEAELGVPFYPGTRPGEGQSSKISTPDGTAYTVGLHSDDTPDKVAAFYRERLKAMSEGKQLVDMNAGDGNATLMLSDEKKKSAIQVHVGKADKGTDIMIVANRGVLK